MTDAQIFQFLGITFFAIGIGMLLNPKFIKDISQDLQSSAINLFYGGLACIAIGFPLITFHNIWNLNTSLIITIMGWMALIKGLMLLVFPAFTMRMYKKVLIKENKYFVIYFVLAVGIISLYLGYFA
jgi:hypothetical protein